VRQKQLSPLPRAMGMGTGDRALYRVTNMVDAAGTTTYSYTAGGSLQSEHGLWRPTLNSGGKCSVTSHISRALTKQCPPDRGLLASNSQLWREVLRHFPHFQGIDEAMPSRSRAPGEQLSTLEGSAPSLPIFPGH
jgi:hypothetical protein